MSALRQIAAVSAIKIRQLTATNRDLLGRRHRHCPRRSRIDFGARHVDWFYQDAARQRAAASGRRGADRLSAEIVSVLTNDAALTIANAPGIKKGSDGRPLVSPETLLIVNLTKKDGDDATAPFRGFTQAGFAVHPEIKMIGGRAFRPGLTEMIVGKSAQRLYSGIDVGAQVNCAALPGRWWAF